MDSFLFTLNAVMPIILCIIVGYVVKSFKLFPDNFWPFLNKLCFRVLLPVLLFKNIYDIEDISLMSDYWKVLLYITLAIIIIFGIGLFIVFLAIKDPKQKGVILQCIVRSNYAIIGIGLISLLASNFDTQEANMAVAVGAVISAVSIPLFNILAIISLSIFVHEDGKKVSVKDVLIKICKNPLIIAVLLGIVVLIIRLAIPYEVIDGTKKYAFKISDNIPFLYTTISWLARSASPIALIALGGGFSFSAIARLKFQITIGTVMRIVVVPVCALLIAYRLGFDKIYFPALIALFGTPVAVSSVPMTQEINSDTELAGQLVVWTSILSSITLFLIILVCSLVGIF